MAVGNSTISGAITQAASPSLRANGMPVANAKVWLENRPDLFAISDANGKYLISKVPAGVYKIVAKYSQGSTIFKVRSVATVVNQNENKNSDLIPVEAKNIVKGTLKNEDGSALTPGTKLYLWGEEFEVKEDGSFETPPMPDFQNIEDAINEIIVNFGLPTQIKLPVTFGNGGQTQKVEFYLPATPERLDLLPRVSLLNVTDGKGAVGAYPNTNSTVRAILFPENPEKIEWSATKGTLGQPTSISGTIIERTWTSPENAGMATISVSVTNAGKTVKASLPILIKGTPKYSVTYSGNGNTGGVIPVDSAAYLEGATVTVKGNQAGLEKTSFTFSGWNTKADGSGTNYLSGDNFKMGTGDLTLYAKWIAVTVTTYAVTYAGNGNTAGTIPTDSQEYRPGDSVSIKDNSGSLVKTSFNFTGWNTRADGTGITYAVGGTFTMESSDMILYAKWTPEAIVSYTVTFDKNGGVTAANPDKMVVAKGETVANLPEAPTKTGHIFTSWNTKTDGTGTEFTAATTVADNITVYAIYSVNKFTVTYTAGQNGSITGSATQVIDYGSDGAAVTATPAPGYKFTSWSDGKTDNPRTDTNVTLNIDVNASFAPINAEINATSKFAYGENVGWINFSSNQGNVAAKLGTNGFLSGFAWGENIGWIKFADSLATAPFANSSANDWGVNIASDGKLAGFAYSENAGWVNFGAANGNASINQQTGELSGYVWGENTGWIKLSGSLYKVQFGI